MRSGTARSRRRAVQILAAVAGCLAIGMPGCGGPGPPAATPTRHAAADDVARNVLLVVIDTLRFDHVGCYGHERATTPTLDHLAATGSRFTQALSTAPWTVPSTASILTSRVAEEHGAEVKGAVRHLGETPPTQIAPQVRSAADVFHDHGFATGLFSANPYLYGRFKRGFDEAHVDRIPADRLTGKIVDWLDRLAADDRFFIHVQYIDLHQPLTPPPPYWALFPAADAGLRESSHSEWAFEKGEYLDTPAFRAFSAQRRALYDGALRFVDSQLDALLAALASRGLRDDTLVVVTSDHGEEFWDHAVVEAQHGGDPRGYYGIGHGQSFYQEQLHVPLVFNGPGVAAGGVLDGWMSLLDVAPTVLARCGLQVPDGMRGRDLSSWLAGRADPADVTGDGPVYASSPAYGPEGWSVVVDGWKYIWRADGRTMLFNLADDPGEHHDLATAEPERAAALERRGTAYRSTLQPADPTAQITIDPALESQLRALGYIQ